MEGLALLSPGPLLLEAVALSGGINNRLAIDLRYCIVISGLQVPKPMAHPSQSVCGLILLGAGVMFACFKMPTLLVML